MLAHETNGVALKVLGLVWRPESDDFTFHLRPLVRLQTEKKGTKRCILQSSACIYFGNPLPLGSSACSKKWGRRSSPGMKNCHQIRPKNGNAGVHNSLSYVGSPYQGGTKPICNKRFLQYAKRNQYDAATSGTHESRDWGETGKQLDDLIEMEKAQIKLWTDSMITFAMDLQFGTKLETVCCKPSDQDSDAYESSFMVTHLIWLIPLTFIRGQTVENLLQNRL